ncbi:MAG: hypothetical protein IPK82_34575 [Polyangiaceae bacterium]|nr:hypothetical protein [Polyangiaceae bacterium]
MPSDEFTGSAADDEYTTRRAAEGMHAYKADFRRRLEHCGIWVVWAAL